MGAQTVLDFINNWRTAQGIANDGSALSQATDRKSNDMRRSMAWMQWAKAPLYRCAKQHSEPGGDKRADQRGSKADELTLTPLELIGRIAALVPPPRTHRHRYYGALAPSSQLRAAAVAMAAPAQLATGQAEPATPGNGALGAGPLGNASGAQPAPQPDQPMRCPAHYLWAVLIARIYEVFPLLCPLCGGQMRIIAFITYQNMLAQLQVQQLSSAVAVSRADLRPAVSAKEAFVKVKSAILKKK